MNKIFKIFMVLAVLLSTACTNVTDKVDIASFYMRDMTMFVNGIEYNGIGVAEVADRYHIRIKAKGTLDVLSIRTCQRRLIFEKAWKKKFFPKKNEFEFIYIPGSKEKETGCGLKFAGYDLDKQHSWGQLLLKNHKYKLIADLECNADVLYHEGVSSCQSERGLIQIISFDSDVYFTTPVGCNEPKIKNGKIEIILSKGECAYVFTSKADTSLTHILVTLGYDDFLLRKDL